MTNNGKSGTSPVTNSLRTYARAKVRMWPQLDEQKRAEIGHILAPVVADLSGGGDGT